MYNNLSGYQNTVKNKIENSSHETLMVMLFDGMITRVKQAMERLNAGQEVAAKACMVRAMKIADALMDSLNTDVENETVTNIENLYYFIISEINQASHNNEPMTHLQNALKVLEILFEGWSSLEKKVLNGNR